MDTHASLSATLNNPGDVVEAWNDLILFVDPQGKITGSNDVQLGYLAQGPRIGNEFWDTLALGTQSLPQTLEKFPPLTIHEISCRGGHSMLLRIIPLAPPLAPHGGYVVIATDNRPMEALYENYEERIENNIASWSDSITLFNAFFDAAKDATFLLDASGTILAANTAAQQQHARSEQSLTGEDCRKLLGKRVHGPLQKAMDTLQNKELWTENAVALDDEGEGFPVEVALRKIVFTSYNLFQLILHDLTAHVELEEDLREKQAEVKEKDIALRQVIKTVEEDRRQSQEHLLDQVKKQMLPALERITSANTATIREGYKSIIEDQLVDLVGNASGESDTELLKLSPRELEICQLIQLGRSGKEVAQLLNISFETVQSHRKNIRKKLHLTGKTQSLFSYLRQKTSLT